MITNVGLDFGNRRVKVCLQAVDENGNLIFLDNGKPKLLFASIPSLYAFDEPIIIKGGQERKTNAFPLLFTIKGKGNVRLWFNDDILASENTIQKIDQAKYTKGHIQMMTQAVLHQWSLTHKIPLSNLGKLNICVSMPPGSYQKIDERKKAEKAYRNAFNTGQSHMQIRASKDTCQIVTRFHSLVREAVVWGSDIPRNNELVLTFDFGGGTDDVILFNGSSEPVDSKTYKIGLLDTYRKINPANIAQVELRILRDKNYIPPALLAYFNQRENIILMALRDLPQAMSKKAYLIGGGAEMIAKNKIIKSAFIGLMPPKKMVIKGQYANSEANWGEASK